MSWSPGSASERPTEHLNTTIPAWWTSLWNPGDDPLAPGDNEPAPGGTFPLPGDGGEYLWKSIPPLTWENTGSSTIHSPYNNI